MSLNGVGASTYTAVVQFGFFPVHLAHMKLSHACAVQKHVKGLRRHRAIKQSVLVRVHDLFAVFQAVSLQANPVIRRPSLNGFAVRLL